MLTERRGYGDPVRLMLDLGNDVDIVTMLVFRGGRRLLVASSEGRGFIVPEDQLVAQRRAGKQVLDVPEGSEAVPARVVEGDHVAVVGENRRLLVFPVDELPERTRGKGVIMQRYRSGGGCPTPGPSNCRRGSPGSRASGRAPRRISRHGKASGPRQAARCRPALRAATASDDSGQGGREPAGGPCRGLLVCGFRVQRSQGADRTK